MKKCISHEHVAAFGMATRVWKRVVGIVHDEKVQCCCQQRLSSPHMFGALADLLETPALVWEMNHGGVWSNGCYLPSASRVLSHFWHAFIGISMTSQTHVDANAEHRPRRLKLTLGADQMNAAVVHDTKGNV